MIELNIKQFGDMNLYNHKNIEKVLSNMIAESANGVLVSVFDDRLVLFDNYEQEFYSADFSFNIDNFIIENFEKIKLKRDKNDFKNSIKSFLKGEIEIDQVEENYENIFSETESLITEEINKKLLEKSGEFSFFNEILKAKKTIDLTSFHETQLYKNYSKLDLFTESIYYFDWSTPVKITLDESEDSNNVYVVSSKEKTLNLWKDEEFTGQLDEAINILIEDVVEGQNKLIDLFDNYKNLAILESPEFKQMISKAILLKNYENPYQIIEGIMFLYKKFGLSNKKKEIQENYILIDEEDQTISTTDSTPAPEAPSNDDMDTTLDALKKLAESTTDEKAKTFLTTVIERVEQSKTDGTIDSNLLKEIARLLSPAPVEDSSIETEKPVEQEPVQQTPQPVA